MKFLTALLSFGFAVNAWAQAPSPAAPTASVESSAAKARSKSVKQEEALTSSLRGYLINSEMRFERTSSQEIIDRKPLNLGLSYTFTKFSVLLLEGSN